MRWLDGITNSVDIEFEQTPGVREGQGSLVCHSSSGCREWNTIEQLNNSTSSTKADGDASLAPRWLIPVVLKFEHASESLGEFVKNQTGAQHPPKCLTQ